ncbi:MAG: ATP-binding protein [Acidimicrobiia bacterium]|nr:ATP-binding protein [Acidimicrobiia bacterium]
MTFDIETSPFVFDGPAPPDDVVGREVEIAALTDRAMHGRFVLLYAPRRYGKTSLIHRIRRDAHDSNDLAVVLVDFLGVQTIDDLSHRIGQALQSVPAGPFASALRKLASRSPEISAQLGYGPASLQLKRGELEAPHLLEELLRLPYKVADDLDCRALVVMDEFQAVADVAKAEAIIRSTIQHQRDRLSYLFAGSEQSILNTIFADRVAPLYGQAEQFRLGRLPDAALAEFIEEKFTVTGRDIGTALPHLLAASRGHPQRAAFLAHQVWQSTGQSGIADEHTWADAYAEVMARSHHEFVAIESGLETGQRKTARLLAWNEPPYGAAARRLGLPKGTAAKALIALERRSLAWRPFGEDLELVDPLFAAWIRERDPTP